MIEEYKETEKGREAKQRRGSLASTGQMSELYLRTKLRSVWCYVAYLLEGQPLRGSSRLYNCTCVCTFIWGPARMNPCAPDVAKQVKGSVALALIRLVHTCIPGGSSAAGGSRPRRRGAVSGFGKTFLKVTCQLCTRLVRLGVLRGEVPIHIN